LQYAQESGLLFIHIPKTAGLSVKEAMAPWSISLTEGAMAEIDGDPASDKSEKFGGYASHPLLGPIHLGHIPLIHLREYFPKTHAIHKRAKCFAILRNPKERFLSAISQNLREYRDVGASRISTQMLLDVGREMMNALPGLGKFADRQYIHFAPQSWFVEDEVEPLNVTYFTIDDMDGLARWMGEVAQRPISFGSRNTTVRPKAKFEKVHGALVGIGSWAPRWLRSAARTAILKLPFYQKSSNAEEFMFDDEVEQFIREFYARDWHLYRAALHG